MLVVDDRPRVRPDDELRSRVRRTRHEQLGRLEVDETLRESSVQLLVPRVVDARQIARQWPGSVGHAGGCQPRGEQPLVQSDSRSASWARISDAAFPLMPVSSTPSTLTETCFFAAMCSRTIAVSDAITDGTSTTSTSVAPGSGALNPEADITVSSLG